MKLFVTMGQKFHHCPGTKGQRDKLKILPRDGTGRDSQNPGRDGTRDKTGQSRKGSSTTEKGCSKTGKDVLKLKNDALNRKSCLFLKIFNSFCSGTKEIPGFLLLPLNLVTILKSLIVLPTCYS